MDKQESNQKSIELIRKLSEKVDKLTWKKEPDVVPRSFSTKLKSGKILISVGHILVFNDNAICVSQYAVTKEDGVAGILASLWGKVEKKIQDPIDDQILLIIEEIDKL